MGTPACVRGDEAGRETADGPIIALRTTTGAHLPNHPMHPLSHGGRVQGEGMVVKVKQNSSTPPCAPIGNSSSQNIPHRKKTMCSGERHSTLESCTR